MNTVSSNIIAISGSKGSGKSSLAAYLSGLIMRSYKIIDGFRVTNDGEIIVGSIEDVKEMNKERLTKVKIEDISNNIVRRYAFADSLKDFCVNVLCIEHHKIYGSQEQKEELTHIRWEDMPGVVTDEDLWVALQNWEKRRKNQKGSTGLNLKLRKPGFMSGREVLQYIGTDVWRSMYPTWAIDSTINKIRKENPKYAIITDLRFDNELVAVKEKYGTAIRLTSKVDESDSHSSENSITTLDKFDIIIDNNDRDLKKVFYSAAGELLRRKVLPPL